MNEVKFKIWQVVTAILAIVVTFIIGVLTAFYMGLSYELEVDKYKFEQYKQSYHEWNEDRKHKKTDKN